jgi:hypothetical protein
MKDPEEYSAIELLELSLRQVSSILGQEPPIEYTYLMLERVAENVESAIHRLKAGELY